MASGVGVIQFCLSFECIFLSCCRHCFHGIWRKLSVSFKYDQAFLTCILPSLRRVLSGHGIVLTKANDDEERVQVVVYLK